MRNLPPSSPDSSGLKDALLFHALFFAFAMPIALTLQGPALGKALLALALLYNVALPVVGSWRRHRGWVDLWLFLLPLSIALPCADWVLVERMGSLQFPDYGVLRLGSAVPIYFMGLWIMLLWPLCWFSGASRQPLAFAGVLGLLAFMLWEWAARPLGLWHAVGVQSWQGFALYPLIPETLLAMGSVWTWRLLHREFWPVQLVGALALAVFYSGALGLALLFIG